MANVLVNDESLKAIADAIREKLDTTNKYKPVQMANAIKRITGTSEKEEGIYAVFFEGCIKNVCDYYDSYEILEE